MIAHAILPSAVQADSYALLVSADAALADTLSVQLQTPQFSAHATRGLVAVVRLAQARAHFRMSRPAVIVLDESACATGAFAMGGESALVAAAREMCETAPVILVCAALRPAELESLAGLVAGAQLDVVTRSGDFAPLVAGLVDRRLTVPTGNQAETPLSGWDANGEALRVESAEEFGEILRHELNNPLTGILGNAELLLARQEQFSSAAVRRLETIASLAVRMRETVRRLSNAVQAVSAAKG